VVISNPERAERASEIASRLARVCQEYADAWERENEAWRSSDDPASERDFAYLRDLVESGLPKDLGQIAEALFERKGAHRRLVAALKYLKQKNNDLRMQIVRLTSFDRDTAAADAEWTAAEEIAVMCGLDVAAPGWKDELDESEISELAFEFALNGYAQRAAPVVEALRQPVPPLRPPFPVVRPRGLRRRPMRRQSRRRTSRIAGRRASVRAGARGDPPREGGSDPALAQRRCLGRTLALAGPEPRDRRSRILRIAGTRSPHLALRTIAA
jgi:hypothetical protein